MNVLLPHQKHLHRQQAYFTGGETNLNDVDVIQLGSNDTIAAPNMITPRRYHSIALLNTRRAPDKSSSSAASTVRLAFSELSRA